jgi:aspartate ammonia-lyase
MAARRRNAGKRAAPRPARIERDSLGEVEIPAGALYSAETVRSVRNLSFSGRNLSALPSYMRALATVKLAAARANRDAHVLDAPRALAIERACRAIIAGEYHDQFVVDPLSGGGSIALNMNVNEVIASLAGNFVGGRVRVLAKEHVNASQSTTDVCHTAARIAIFDEWQPAHAALDFCVLAMRAKEREFREVITIARTCLQDASPVALGTLFGGYAAAIARRTAEVDRAVDALRMVNLGGTVIGSGEGAPAAYRRRVLKHLRDATGLRLTRRQNLYDAAQNFDDLGGVAASLGLLAEVLMKVAQDLRLLSSGPEGGFSEIRLPAVQHGSSFFSGKINPVVPETLIQCCFMVLGCERAVRLALERGELNLNVFEGAAAISLLDALAMLTRAVSSFTEFCVKGITANEDRCRDLASRSRYR